MSKTQDQLSVDIRDQLTLAQASCKHQLMVETQEIRDAFVSRLNQSLDSKEGVRKGRGRNVDFYEGVRKHPAFSASTQATHKWLKAESMPSRANMRAIAEWLGVRVEWLQYGEGEPHQPATPPESADQGRCIVPSAPTNSDSEQCDQKPGGRQVGQHLAAGRALFDRMTPRSRTLVARILEMEAQGALTDEDIQMLEKIVERFGTTR